MFARIDGLPTARYENFENLCMRIPHFLYENLPSNWKMWEVIQSEIGLKILSISNLMKLLLNIYGLVHAKANSMGIEPYISTASTEDIFSLLALVSWLLLAVHLKFWISVL